MGKLKRNFNRESHLDTVGVVGSTPIAPTIKSTNKPLKNNKLGASWLADKFQAEISKIAKTSTNLPRHCGKIAVIKKS